MTLSSEPTITELLENNPLVSKAKLWKSQIVMNAFSEFIVDGQINQWHLTLSRFVDGRPFMYLQKETIRETLDFFEKTPEVTFEAIMDLKEELSHSIFSLLRPSTSWDKETIAPIDKPEGIAEFDSVWHPEYQRYIEHIFNHLIGIPLFILGKDKGKDYLSLKLTNRIERLNAVGLSCFVDGANSVVRNAISHGKTFYEMYSVTYKDERSEIRLSGTEFLELFDTLVDTCNSIVFALLLFFSRREEQVNSLGIENLPLAFSFLIINALISHPGAELQSMQESIIGGNQRQLNAVCKVTTTSRATILMEAFNIAASAINLLGDHYHRYFFYFDCGMPGYPAIALNGRKLLEAITLNKPFSSASQDVVDTSALWYDSPRYASRLYLWKNLLKLEWKITRHEILAQWRKVGLVPPSSRYKIVASENTSNHLEARVTSYAVLAEHENLSEEELRPILRSMLRKIRRLRVRRTDIRGEKGMAVKPKAVFLKVFSREYRLRKLKGLSYNDNELIFIVEWFSYTSKSIPFYTKEPDIEFGRTRIRFNPNQETY